MTRSPVGFQYGELILAIRACGSKSLFLLKQGGKYRQVTHDDLRGRDSVYVQCNGVTFRRPTLDEYVVLMERVPAPTYPKDAQTMVAQMDVGEGSRVVEAGAGSGGLTLQLSKNGNIQTPPPLTEVKFQIHWHSNLHYVYYWDGCH